MRLAAFVAALLFYVGSSISLAAESVPPIPGSLWLVKTEGTWEQGSSYGYYRVLVFRRGGEAAFDTVYFQILVANPDTGESKVLRNVKMDTPEYRGNIMDVTFSQISAKEMQISLHISMRALEGKVQQEVYAFGPGVRPHRVVP